MCLGMKREGSRIPTLSRCRSANLHPPPSALSAVRLPSIETGWYDTGRNPSGGKRRKPFFFLGGGRPLAEDVMGGGRPSALRNSVVHLHINWCWASEPKNRSRACLSLNWPEPASHYPALTSTHHPPFHLLLHRHPPPPITLPPPPPPVLGTQRCDIDPRLHELATLTMKSASP
jgi:hypothetical protein